jgi:hypothetical protein
MRHQPLCRSGVVCATTAAVHATGGACVRAQGLCTPMLLVDLFSNKEEDERIANEGSNFYFYFHVNYV